MIGLINTTYSVGGIICGWFFSGPLVSFPNDGLRSHIENNLTLPTQADWAGRRWAMAFGCAITVVATFIQCFAPYHNLGCFMAGRVLIGAGQAFAISK
jgi:MFS family permease